jgi:hypothetical protein
MPMNSAPFLLVPFATVALLSSNPSKTPTGDSAEIAALLNRPEVQAIIKQIQQSTGPLAASDQDQSDLLDLPDPPSRRSHTRAREQGLHTGHLTTSEVSSDEGYFSAASGLTSEDEWQQMFPRYALKRVAAH